MDGQTEADAFGSRGCDILGHGRKVAQVLGYTEDKAGGGWA
eukprot:SAG22_NODE_29_length_28404_cov_23.294153_10_plen_41_part_00